MNGGRGFGDGNGAESKSLEFAEAIMIFINTFLKREEARIIIHKNEGKSIEYYRLLVVGKKKNLQLK